MVLLLHGAGRTGESIVDMWREVAEVEGLVLVAPNFAGANGYDGGLPDPRYLAVALDHAATLCQVDRSRIVMFGHSKGAIGAQLLANRFDGPWRAVAAHAGTAPARFFQPTNGVPIRHYLGSQNALFPYGAGLDAA